MNLAKHKFLFSLLFLLLLFLFTSKFNYKYFILSLLLFLYLLMKSVGSCSCLRDLSSFLPFVSARILLIRLCLAKPRCSFFKLDQNENIVDIVQLCLSCVSIYSYIQLTGSAAVINILTQILWKIYKLKLNLLEAEHALQLSTLYLTDHQSTFSLLSTVYLTISLTLNLYNVYSNISLRLLIKIKSAR